MRSVALSPATREEALRAMADTELDILVIGGGVVGAGSALDAALRGLKVALVEARDFASGTSSRSSKLIHGGLRYLEQLRFKLVREARQERRLLVRLAPHLARPVPFLLPIYRQDQYSPLKVRLGLTVYDLMGNLGREDRHRMLDSRSAVELVPGLRSDGLRAPPPQPRTQPRPPGGQTTGEPPPEPAARAPAPAPVPPAPSGVRGAGPGLPGLFPRAPRCRAASRTFRGVRRASSVRESW